MSFLNRVLGPEEELLVHSHPHWRTLIRPALVTIIGAGLAGIACGFAEAQISTPGDQRLAWAVILGMYLIVALRFALWPVWRWARTDVIVTSQRVVYRPAGSRRRGVDVPLARVTAVRFRHTLAERALGTGSLILECGQLPPVEIDEVPRVARVHAVVYEELGRLPWAQHGALPPGSSADPAYRPDQPVRPWSS